MKQNLRPNENYYLRDRNISDHYIILCVYKRRMKILNTYSTFFLNSDKITNVFVLL